MKLAHTAFFGDGEHTFALTDDMIIELERLADLGIGALYLRAANMQFKLTDLVEVIRLGLIGGGTTPERAAQLVDTYARNTPIDALYPLALDVLDARWGGAADKDPDPEPASAAMSEAA
ncbi:MAG: gene transfer agent family protein [Pseudophaeobacter sp. bin_em_oilr2.035]|uniref:Gene transfer agent family protein n=1 Tax=Phaeobacter gallaeciensis TaxID=60890 RepID=A0ABD4X4Z5_9RHOB|nr:gene transfer agent family protein [Phaeobacter gallaeciensis]MDF1770486.1 gene transfer agent family protein [Pseudophaeobacter sp. bin_em_oilr2.035]MDE4143176.1 gene transfer agent family protein [Phaeobacter gallaeciensis]MDE4156462.1 gene transfer agent family protein [Phaeobacter gallaeciensis]MDE4160649.1 gene transfer agent family protein [Phaeobacter gallaeciensis]MDE4164257.1 gene transfer agent family protein [Phaeobacter gallaeciensis]